MGLDSQHVLGALFAMALLAMALLAMALLAMALLAMALLATTRYGTTCYAGHLDLSQREERRERFDIGILQPKEIVLS